ncbi:unnamed protein product [Albugo candida]|uniref:Uncharacterized protein n=1 Tax=Albugo candida TaxID=65357 RepID=A0A024GUN5_9STRA|nr:unnamed protein product [Albugo candida]|eukprot:CCI50077.1 unnamed protein product [Albugo candida]
MVETCPISSWLTLSKILSTASVYTKYLTVINDSESNVLELPNLVATKEEESREKPACANYVLICRTGYCRDQVSVNISATMNIITKPKYIRNLAAFKCRKAKLFSRHTKIEQQEWQLKKFYSPIAIGTPARVKKLVESGGLSLQNTAFLIIDMHMNQKVCSILDLKETSFDLMEFHRYHFMKKLSQDNCKLILY